jgi:pimeloyl-ACP methyl ester carboxylesterase
MEGKVMSMGKVCSYFQTPDGTNLYYEDQGKGIPLVLVHGWTCSSKIWQKNIPELAGRFRVITMDLRGHGNSVKTLSGHQVSQYGRDVRALLEHLDVKDAVLVGWSLGGPVVLSYWEQYHDDSRLRGIGMIDSNTCPFSSESWNAHRLKNFNVDGMTASFTAMADDPAGFAAGFARRMFHKEQVDYSDLQWIVAEIRKTPVWVAIAIYSDYVTKNFTAILPTITIPGIVFAADSAVAEKGVEQGRYLAGLIPKGQFAEFKNAGHILFFEQPDEFNAVLTRFVTSI